MPTSPTPVALKVARGTLKVGRTNPNMPTPEEGAPPTPRDLAPDELAAWKMLVKDLTALHVLSPQDGAALKMLAVTYARWERLVTVLREEGHVYRTKSKSGVSMIRPRPEVVLERRAFQQFNILAGKFGLTPSDRQRVSTIPNKKRNTLDEFRTPRGMDEFAGRR